MSLSNPDSRLEARLSISQTTVPRIVRYLQVQASTQQLSFPPMIIVGLILQSSAGRWRPVTLIATPYPRSLARPASPNLTVTLFRSQLKTSLCCTEIPASQLSQPDHDET